MGPDVDPVWACTSTSPGKSVPPLPSISGSPGATTPGAPTAAIRPSRTTTSRALSSTEARGASKTRTLRTTSERGAPGGRDTSGGSRPQATTAIRTASAGKPRTRPPACAARVRAMCSTPLRSASRVAEHGLQLEELSQAGFAPLAAVARLLVAAEGRAQVGLRPVHVHVARADAFRHSARALDVARGDVAREPVGRVVGDANRVLLVLVRDDGKDGAEDLLARDRHVVAHVGEHRRADEVALAQALRAPRPAGHQLGALLDALLDQALHLIELRLAGERPDGDAVRGGVPDRDRLGGGLRHPRARHEHARRRVARL